MKSSLSIFQWSVRVYYEDTDAGGVVYHSQYLNFMERARTEYLRSLGFEHTELKTELGVLLVVRSLSLQYKKPARFDDVLQIKTELKVLGRSLMQFEQTIVRGEEVLNLAQVEVVCVDALKFKPVSIPLVVKNVILNNSALNNMEM